MSIIKNINAKTDVYCIFGKPVKHSLSPAMQNAAFSAMGINAVYTAFEINDISSGIQAMKALNIKGASVTIPFKQDVIKFIDESDDTAARINAVNTLVNRDGTVYGYNTDASGAVNALLNNKVELSGSNVLILGNGGSARTISFALMEQGAFVSIAGRNPNNIKMLVNDLNKNSKVEYYLFNELSQEIMNNIDIIINTTSVGMEPETNISPLKSELILKKHTVFDIVYAPNNTRLLSDAKSKGCRIIRGIEMLLNQGAAQFEIWTGQKAPLREMKKVLKSYIN